MRDGHITEDLNEQLFTNEPSNKEFQISDWFIASLRSCTPTTVMSTDEKCGEWQ